MCQNLSATTCSLFRIQCDWNLLFWCASFTTVSAYHLSVLYWVHLSAIYFASVQGALVFLTQNFTRRRDWNINRMVEYLLFIALLEFIRECTCQWKNFWNPSLKSVNVCGIYVYLQQYIVYLFPLCISMMWRNGRCYRTVICWFMMWYGLTTWVFTTAKFKTALARTSSTCLFTQYVNYCRTILCIFNYFTKTFY